MQNTAPASITTRRCRSSSSDLGQSGAASRRTSRLPGKPWLPASSLRQGFVRDGRPCHDCHQSDYISVRLQMSDLTPRGCVNCAKLRLCPNVRPDPQSCLTLNLVLNLAIKIDAAAALALHQQIRHGWKAPYPCLSILSITQVQLQDCTGSG